MFIWKWFITRFQRKPGDNSIKFPYYYKTWDEAVRVYIRIKSIGDLKQQQQQ